MIPPLMPLVLSYYRHNKSRTRRQNKPKRITLMATLLVLLMLPEKSISLSTEEQEQEAGLRPEEQSISEESTLLRLARLSEKENPSKNGYPKTEALLALDAAPTNPNSKEEAYKGIPDDPKFHGAPCNSDKDCYKLFGKSLECKSGTCQCLAWKGIKLIWTEKSNICLGGVGHPCATKTMCHSEKCEKGLCVKSGGGPSRTGLLPRNRLLREIVIHISVLIVARFVLRMGL